MNPECLYVIVASTLDRLSVYLTQRVPRLTSEDTVVCLTPITGVKPLDQVATLFNPAQIEVADEFVQFEFLREARNRVSQMSNTLHVQDYELRLPTIKQSLDKWQKILAEP